MSTAIRVENIKKTLGKREILKGISFKVSKGDIFGYLGPNGAGKTTTIRVLLGLFKADGGKLEILGHDITEGHVRRQIGFVLDADGLYDHMTAEENIYYYARIYGLAKDENRMFEVLDMVKLRSRSKDRVGTYSRGMRQRLALARAMVHNPQILILDEPTSGVDPSGQIEVRQIMLDLAHQQNKTIFLSSHNLDEVQRICNRIALIDRGEIKLYGELESLRQDMEDKRVYIEVSPGFSSQAIEELKELEPLGLQDIKGCSLVFAPGPGTGVSDIISALSARGLRIEQAVKKEASLEEIYSSILKETEPS